MRRAAIAVAACALFAWAPIARAASGSLVTVVRPAGADRVIAAAAARLVAELEAAGFVVRVIDAVAGGDGRGEVEALDASRAPAFATIAILATDRGAVADVWIADHVTKKTVVRRVDVRDPTRADAASDLALHAVELLRASLLEVGAQTKDLAPDLARWLSPPEATASPAVAPPPERTPSKTASTKRDPLAGETIALGVGALVSAAGFGVSPGPILGVGYGLGRGLALRLAFAPSLATTELRAPLGRTLLLEQTTRLDLAFAYRGLPIAPTFALGGGLYHVHADAQGSGAVGGESRDMFAGFFSAGVGLEARIAPSFAFVCELAALVVQPDRAVDIGGVEAGRAGRPLVLTSLGFLKGF